MCVDVFVEVTGTLKCHANISVVYIYGIERVAVQMHILTQCEGVASCHSIFFYSVLN